MRHGMVALGFVLISGLLVDGDLEAGSLEPPGPPAPTMKSLQQVEARTPISSLPFNISEPGSYYLTSDLTGEAGIFIETSFVSLDLNGFSLIGQPGAVYGILVADGAKHVEIRHGVIRAWDSNGLAASSSLDIRVEDVRVADNDGFGIALGPRSIVRNTSSTGNSLGGIVTGADSIVTGCTADGNGGSGIAVGARSLVSGSTASSNVSQGFFLQESLATDCFASQNSQGFFLNGPGGRVARSVARNNAIGFFGDDGVTIEECTAEGNTDDGIRVGSRGVVRGNFARGNTNDGVHALSNQNRIEENTSNLNGTGIRVTGVNNLIVRNSLGNNTVETSIIAGNRLGPISLDPATAGPWANFDL